MCGQSRMLLWMLLTCSLASSSRTSVPTIKLRLYNELMQNYTRDMRPSLNATKVKLDPALYSIIDIDEARESMVMSQWFEMTWFDELLQWNPIFYGGITKIRVLQSRIFIPDISVYQLIKSERMGTLEDSFITVAYDGTVFMTRSELLTIHCNFDVAQFPYDKQNASLTYVAWSHPASEIELVPGSAPKARDSYFQESTEWALLSYEVHSNRVDYGPEVGAWDELTYYIAVERKPFYYIITLTVPSFMLINLALIGIFSPSSSNHDRTEKVSIGLTALLTMAVILMMVSDLMPKNSTSFPNLGKYIMWEMSVMASCTVLAVGIMYLNGLAAFEQPVPPILARYLLGNYSYSFSSFHDGGSSNAGESQMIATHPDDAISMCQMRKHAGYNHLANGYLASRRLSTGKPTEETAVESTDTNQVTLNATVHQQPQTSTDPLQTKMLNSMKQVSVCVRNVERSVTAHLNDVHRTTQLREEWMRVCCRLDIIGLVMSIAFNSAVTFIFYMFP